MPQILSHAWLKETNEDESDEEEEDKDEGEANKDGKDNSTVTGGQGNKNDIDLNGKGSPKLPVLIRLNSRIPWYSRQSMNCKSLTGPVERNRWVLADIAATDATYDDIALQENHLLGMLHAVTIH